MAGMGTLEQLLEAETKAWQLFEVAEERNYFTAGQTEKDLSNRLYDLAFELFAIKKYWHKRIVRSGRNTLLPYSENPPDLALQPDDILFVDFGPVFEKWEADIGKTYVIGDDARKLKLSRDVESVWDEVRDYYIVNKETITGAELYAFAKKIAQEYGWAFGNTMAGHLVGRFPHEVIPGDKIINYIHPDNRERMSLMYPNGTERFWILEIHMVDAANQMGGFYEKVLR
ncbi:MAG: aminopeptidase P family protein [Sphingobacteriales bacterium JAD_PAG50586_3]|nr:MAG: aminopeptidase P family protein [Sphingobacteriales bacterium JAD_PAG50586_3]